MTWAFHIFNIEPGLKRYLKISAFIHIIFLIVLFFSTTSPASRQIQREGVYRVSIKSLPTGIPKKTAPLQGAESSVSQQKEAKRVVTLPAPETLPSKESKREKPKDIKAKKNEKALSTAREEKKVKKKESAGEDDILAMLNSARRELSQRRAGEVEQRGSGTETGELLTGATLSGTAREYYDSVERKIKDSWVLPGAMAQEAKKLKTIIGIIVRRDGTIEKIWIEQSSGNIYYDRAALRAVKKSSPLPPLPSQMPDKYLEIGIIF